MKFKAPFRFKLGRRGFTLLETLLAVTLFAIVMTSSYGVFSMGIQIWRRAQGRPLVERQAVLSLERMSRDVRNTLRVPPTGDEFGKDTPEYEGDGVFFSIPAVVSSIDKYGTAITQSGSVSYRWNSNGELCRSEKSATDLYLRREPECRVLADSIKKLQFQYLLYVSFTKSYSWFDNWNIKDGLPHAVRVSFDVAPKLKDGKTGSARSYQQTFLIPVAVTSEKDTDLLPRSDTLT